MKLRTTLCILAVILVSACNKEETELIPHEIDNNTRTLTINRISSPNITLKNNMKLVCFEIQNLLGVNTYKYFRSYDLNILANNLNSNSWSQSISDFPCKPMGVILVVQEDITSKNTYKLPTILQETDAEMINLPLTYSFPKGGDVVSEAPVILASDLTTINWNGTETTKTLNLNLKRRVGKLIIKINDPFNLMGYDYHFAITNTYTALRYNMKGSGSTTTALPTIIQINSSSKQGVIYLLPSIGSESIGITAIHPQLTLKINAGKPLQILPNKQTILTLNYNADKSLRATVVIKDWEEIIKPIDNDCYDITDSEGIGYKVINVAGQLWFDRDLGAQYNMPRDPLCTTAESITSNDDWGYTFQFGRLLDGHQKRTSLTTTTKINNPTSNTNSSFICTPTTPYSWLITNPANKATVLWRMPQQNNNPAPKGFRLPTFNELKLLYSKLSFDNTLGLYYVDGVRRGKTVRMYMAGKTYRKNTDGTISFTPNNGLYYWTDNSKWIGDNFYGTIPTISLSGNTIIVGDNTGVDIPSTNGCHVRCIMDNN